jgi:hypothetical protein
MLQHSDGQAAVLAEAPAQPLRRRFRNSQLALRRECGHAYRRAYVDRDPGVPSPSLRAGQNVHAAVGLAIRELLTAGMVNVHKIAAQTIRGSDVEYVDALEVLTRVQEALGVEWEIDPDGVILIEETLEMPLELSTGEVVDFFGTPDLVERLPRRRCRITDFKTNWHPESEAQFRAGPQLKRYALLIAEHYPGFEEFELIKRFVRYRNSSFTETITRAHLVGIRQALVSEIEEAIEYETAAHFEATPGSWCSLCREHATCPIILRYRRHGIDDLSIPDDERARQLAGDAIALDASRSAMQERLKRYLGAEHAQGWVPVVGGTYGYGPVERRKVPAAALEQVLRTHKIEPAAELWKTDLDVLDRMMRRLPEDTVRAIDGITRRWQTSECRFRKGAPPGSSASDEGTSEPQELFS